MQSVQLKPFDFAAAVQRAGMSAPSVKPQAAAATDFAAVMGQALQSVSLQQGQAQNLQRDLQLDKPGVSLEETMISMQKAQIGFQAVLQVRNRLVSAYTDIMNMPV